MSVFKCKMCGGTVEFEPGSTVGVCDSCGTKQTLPRLDDDRRANLYDRANHFRRNNEFDKAAGIYEQILAEDTTDAEAYWSLVLCQYGIEYVEDPATRKRVPTVNRAQFTSVFDDGNYKSALRYADGYQRAIYEKEAAAINEIQKGILAISQREEPFDVFICYKETDRGGRRTQDSVLANELYHQLTQEGFKVFFSRITLEDKLGTAYEPYIFAALNSAKVMVVLGTRPEHFNAAWVRNEWSRYLALVKQSGGRKVLIPAYRDMDPYDLPEEFSHLQAQDMSKLGFMQDLIRGIKKIAGDGAPRAKNKETVVTGGVVDIAPLLKRAFLFLEDGNWAEAGIYCEKVLDHDPENAEAYLGKLMAECHARRKEDLKNCAEPFDNSPNFQKVVRFGDEATTSVLNGYIADIKARNEESRLAGIYQRGIAAINTAKTEEAFNWAAAIFKTIPGYKNADALAEESLKKAEAVRKDAVYASACSEMSKNVMTTKGYESAIQLFRTIPGWRDADEKINECQKKIEEVKAERERRRILREASAKKRRRIIIIAASITAVLIVFIILVIAVIIPSGKYYSALELYESGKYDEAIEVFRELDGYKDSRAQIENCENAKINAKNEETYNSAMELYEAGKYDKAIEAFLSLDGYKDSAEQITKCKNAMLEKKYDIAMGHYHAKEYERAITLFEELDGYKDSEEQITVCKNAILDEKYNSAMELYNAEEYDKAYKAFCELKYKDSSEKAEECRFLAQKATLSNVSAGSTVKFGYYEQDGDESNGEEEIEWTVLAVDGDKALIVSIYALDCKPFNDTYEKDITWENCSLRTWLNDTFYKAAFGEKHQEMIRESTVTTEVVLLSEDDKSGGTETKDKVFLLSATEVNEYFNSDDERICQGTKYCFANGAYKIPFGDDYCNWWLRSPGYNQYTAAIVEIRGYVSDTSVNSEKPAVRPAMWIKLG